MPISRTFIALAAAFLVAAAALAADPPGEPPAAAVQAAHPSHPVHAHPAHRGACLSKPEQRAAVAAHQAISLADAIRSLRASGRRAEVVRARLCRKGDKLAYLLTLLGRSGKVRRVQVDAATAEVVIGR